jgi:hypothetical protein
MDVVMVFVAAVVAGKGMILEGEGKPSKKLRTKAVAECNAILQTANSASRRPLTVSTGEIVK